MADRSKRFLIFENCLINVDEVDGAAVESEETKYNHSHFIKIYMKSGNELLTDAYGNRSTAVDKLFELNDLLYYETRDNQSNQRKGEK